MSDARTSDPTSGQVIIGRRVHLEQRLLPRSDGKTELRDMVVHPGSIVVLPLLDDGRVVMIRNRRFAVEQTLLELCAGTLEPGEEIASCAARELEEETGYRARELTPLLAFYPSPGVSNERMNVFVARGLSPTKQHLDPSEQIEVELLPLSDVLTRIRGGAIEDAKTIAAILYFHTWGAA